MLNGRSGLACSSVYDMPGNREAPLQQIMSEAHTHTVNALELFQIFLFQKRHGGFSCSTELELHFRLTSQPSNHTILEHQKKRKTQLVKSPADLSLPTPITDTCTPDGTPKTGASLQLCHTHSLTASMLAQRYLCFHRGQIEMREREREREREKE